MDESFVNTGVGSSSDVPAASPFTLPPTTLHHNLRRQHDAIGELFDNVNEMTVVGKMGEEDEETAVWVYHINVSCMFNLCIKPAYKILKVQRCIHVPSQL